MLKSIRKVISYDGRQIWDASLEILGQVHKPKFDNVWSMATLPTNKL